MANIESEGLSTKERRFGPRRAVDVKVFAHDGVELRKCTLRDIGLQGAFIETNFALPEDTAVELVLRVNREGKHLHCRFPAKVVRTKADGAALRFDALDQLAQQILVDLIYADDSQRGIEASY